MKTVNNIFKHTFFCLALGTTVCSCDLDVEPTSSIATETFWTSEKDAWYNLNAVYSASIPGAAVHSDSYTNDAYCQYSWESNGAIYQQNGLSALYDEGYNFETVRKQNIFLQEIENVPMDEDLKTRFKAEVRAMRAWTYLNLTTTFGKVPLITDVLSYDAPNIPRDETSKIREFILNELTEAAAILPEKYAGSYPNEKGRMTKYAALAVKARAALYFGDYPTAEAAAKEIMDKGGFSLFQVSELTEAQKKEAEEMELYIDFDKYGIDRDKFMTQNLVDAYWTVDGKTPSIPSIEKRMNAYKVIKGDLDEYKAPAGEAKFISFASGLINSGKLKDYEYMQEFRNRDSRLYASILFPFKGWYETNYGTNFIYEWIKNGNNESKTGFNFRKMSPLENDANNDGQATGDYPCIRYAEVLLIFAEAHTQTTGFDGQTQAALNQLRDRCGMPNVPTSLGKEDGLALIKNERRIELAGEGLRSDDLSRYGDAYWSAQMNNVPISTPDGEKVITMKWDSRMSLRPIPQTAIDLNPLLATDQNPGY